MERWISKYTTVAPFGVISFTMLFWTIDGQKLDMARFAGFVDLAVVAFAAFLVLMEEGVSPMFYAIAQRKRRERVEENARVLERLKAVAKEDQIEVLQALVRQMERGKPNGGD